MSKSRGKGKREPNGRLQREPVHAIRETVALQRCRAMGWKPTLDNQKKAASATYGTAHGILLGRGWINMDQYHAAEHAFKVDSEYRSIKELPRSTVSAVNLEGGGGHVEPEPNSDSLRKKVEIAASRLADVNAALIEAKALSTVMTLVIHQQDIDEFAAPIAVRGLQMVFNQIVQPQRRKAG